MLSSFKDRYLLKSVEAVPLAVFRILFGLMMLMSLIRFWSNGWIDKLYIKPGLFFSYYGFQWIKPLGNLTYLLFAICGIAALFVALGYRYRTAIIVFFLSFTYIELMDKTTYLNHYYFISVLAFLMIFLPVNVYYSLDGAKNTAKRFQKVPAWTINSIKLLLGMVYFYAGLAKLNSDWLFRAMPLKIWLPSKFDIPLLGDFMQREWVHYAFSWSGALYDLSIPFLLLYKKTRPLAFVLVVFFHVMTRVLFPIGMFPFIMIVASLIFFDAGLHHKLLDYLDKLLKLGKRRFDNGKNFVFRSSGGNRFVYALIVVFFMVQLTFPWRYLLYPGQLFWTEEGFRFSWRVMLMEKTGYAQFKIVDGKTGSYFYVDNSDFLTVFQEKQMAFQPDFILEYAHFLKQHFAGDGHKNIEVYVENYVSLNGRLSTPMIDPKVDLAKEEESFKHKNWIIPFSDDINIQGI